jgi:TPR repeat protein
VVAAWKTQPEAAKYDWTKEHTTGFAAIVSPKPEAVRTLLDVGYDAPSMLRLASTYFQINIVELLLKRGGLSGNHIQGEIAYLEGLGELMKSAESIPNPDRSLQDILRELGVLKAELELLKAELGDAQSQDKLGKILFEGSLGVAKDEVEAVKWLRKAAEQNLADAQLNLGVCYANGQGVAKDEVEAVKWYRKAAEQNLALAENSLGACYANGQGVAKDEVEAVKWYRKAAEQKDAYAQKNLGVCYGIGRGVAKDEVEAVKWFRKAAEQNNASAQGCLGNCYASGQGVAKDQTEAVKWYRKAAEGGELYAVNALAWILATTENSAIRDGANAVVFAKTAVSVAEKFPKENEKHLYLDTLAAAYAEAGQFEKAASTEQEAIGLVQTEADKNDYKARLKLFEAKLPYRAKD